MIMPTTYVPTDALGDVREFGLMSGERIVKDKELLKRIAKARGESPRAFASSVRNVLASRSPDSARGLNVLFQAPPNTQMLSPSSPLRTKRLTQIKIDLKRLLKEIPGVRLSGFELVPFDEKAYEKDPDAHLGLRRQQLTAPMLRSLMKATPEESWQHYNADTAGGMYAPDVPHMSIVTPSGNIPSRFLRFSADAPQKTAETWDSVKYATLLKGLRSASNVANKLRPMVTDGLQHIATDGLRPMVTGGLKHITPDRLKPAVTRITKITKKLKPVITKITSKSKPATDPESLYLNELWSMSRRKFTLDRRRAITPVARVFEYTADNYSRRDFLRKLMSDARMVRSFVKNPDNVRTITPTRLARPVLTKISPVGVPLAEAALTNPVMATMMLKGLGKFKSDRQLQILTALAAAPGLFVGAQQAWPVIKAIGSAFAKLGQDEGE